MRFETLKTLLSSYDFTNADILAKIPIVNGGWEVWLQVEFGMQFVKKCNEKDINFSREVKYPCSSQKCDFHFSYGSGKRDETYFELKCINPFHKNPKNDAISRFVDDIVKVHSIKEQNNYLLNCVCMLYYVGDETEFRQKIEAKGIDSNNIKICGIPNINSSFIAVYI